MLVWSRIAPLYVSLLDGIVLGAIPPWRSNSLDFRLAETLTISAQRRICSKIMAQMQESVAPQRVANATICAPLVNGVLRA